MSRPWEEPGAGNPQARICEGEAEWLSYSTAGASGCGLTIATSLYPKKKSPTFRVIVGLRKL
jgi:hypothetical protein